MCFKDIEAARGRAGRMARSTDDDPTIISQIVRVALVAVASNTVKRILAQSEPDEAQLVALQSVLRLRKDIPIGRLRGGDNAPCKPFCWKQWLRENFIPLDEPDKRLPVWLDKDLAFLLFQDQQPVGTRVSVLVCTFRNNRRNAARSPSK